VNTSQEEAAPPMSMSAFMGPSDSTTSPEAGPAADAEVSTAPSAPPAAQEEGDKAQ
jgi:hypothetical protein